MSNKFRLEDIVKEIYNHKSNYLRMLQLEEAAHHLKLFMQQHKLQNENFHSFQHNLQSYMPKIRKNIVENKSTSTNTARIILIGVCALIEVALIKNNKFYAIGIHLCGNTFNSNTFPSQERIKCMTYIQNQMSNVKQLEEDLNDYDEHQNCCNIIDELEVDTTEAPKWISELNIAKDKAIKNQSFKPIRIINNNNSTDIKEDNVNINNTSHVQYPPIIYPSHDKRKEKFIRHYSLNECRLIIDALIIVMTDELSINNNTIRVRGMNQSDVEKFKGNAIELMHLSSPNLLAVICDSIARNQLTHFQRHSQFDVKLDDCMRNFLVNLRGIKITNMQPLHRQGTVMKRMMNYIPFMVALYSQIKLKESPKPMQLIIALMIYRAETEIINAYKSIDYNEKHIKCIDTICVYLPKMMDIIYRQLKRDKKRGCVIMEIQEKGYHDPDYTKTETFYKRIFGSLAQFISKHASATKNEKNEKRFLLRVFVLLGRDQTNGGFLYRYPRCIYSLQILDNVMQKRINNNNIYQMFVNIEHPIHIYPVQLAINRYQSDALMLVSELRNILHPGKSYNPFEFVHKKKKKYDLKKEMKESYDDKLSSEDRIFVHLMETHYTMFTTIIYPQQYRNGELFFTRKMYNLRATGIFRFMEQDILKILPKYFEQNTLANYLEKAQLQSIKNGRHKCCKDEEFEEFQQEFESFNKAHNVTPNPNFDDDDGDDNDSDDSTAVSYGNEQPEQDLHYGGSIISDIMDGKQDK